MGHPRLKMSVRHLRLIPPRARMDATRRKLDAAAFRRCAAKSLYIDTAISLSKLGRLALLRIANLTFFENLDLARWRRWKTVCDYSN